MARRVSIGKNNVASPFIVSTGGVDAAFASDFTQILFDANQQPLRLRETGYIAWVNAPAEGVGVSTLRSTTPYSFGGLYPMVFAAGKAQGGAIGVSYLNVSNPRDSPPTYFRQYGMGLIVTSEGWIYGVNFSEQYWIPGTPYDNYYIPPPVIMYYALLWNMG